MKSLELKPELAEEVNQKYTSLTQSTKLDQTGKITPRNRNNSDISDVGAKKSNLVDVSESAVQDELNNVDKKEDESDVIQEIIPISLQMFWDNFLADNAKFSLADFFAEQKEKNIEMSKWEPKDSSEASKQVDEEEKGKPDEEQKDTSQEEVKEVAENPQNPDTTENLKRELNFVVAIKGVPFWYSSKCNKLFFCTKSPTKIEMITEVRTPDVPYGSYFYLQERWIIGCPVANANKVFLKVYISVKIVKPTMIQKKLEAK